jgi:hypothetical protein
MFRMFTEGVDDLVMVSNPSNSEITKQLGARFDRELIYTNVGDVLISVNPYRKLPNTGDEHVRMYQNSPGSDVPPHIFALAEKAYRRLADDKESQCVIISGESGAGKTVSAKLILQYITAVSPGGQASSTTTAPTTTASTTTTTSTSTTAAPPPPRAPRAVSVRGRGGAPPVPGRGGGAPPAAGGRGFRGAPQAVPGAVSRGGGGGGGIAAPPRRGRGGSGASVMGMSSSSKPAGYVACVCVCVCVVSCYTRC